MWFVSPEKMIEARSRMVEKQLAEALEQRDCDCERVDDKTMFHR